MQKIIEPSLSPARAVLYGHFVVSLPVIIIFGIGYLSGYAVRGPMGGLIGLIAAALVAWLWWSTTIPRWREWAKGQGADEGETQRIGRLSGLVWPKGSVFEKTEFKIRKKV